jgi:hypothetical protein
MIASTSSTAEELIEALAEAGELDAGVEVLDALRMRDPSASLVHLQAKLFDAPDDRSIEAKREALAPWREGALDGLLQRGAFLEVAAALRVMTRVFADEPVWRERHARIETLVTPLPNPHDDPSRSAFDAAIARGEVSEAWDRLRALLRQDPSDPDLARRLEALREVVYPPTGTRPYEALREPVDASAVTALAQRIPERIASGDLEGALLDASTLAGQPGASPRWLRFREALQRLVAWANTSRAAPSDQEATARTGPIEQVELWLRAGQLGQARDALRRQVSMAPAALASQLVERLADLDVVLDTTLPTPVPPRPSSQAHVAVAVARAPEPPRIATPPAALQAPSGTEDTEPSRRSLTPALPPTPSSDNRPSAPQTTGEVRLGKRRIVRLK